MKKRISFWKLMGLGLFLAVSTNVLQGLGGNWKMVLNWGIPADLYALIFMGMCYIFVPDDKN
jgi:hypothetical protein